MNAAEEWYKGGLIGNRTSLHIEANSTNVAKMQGVTLEKRPKSKKYKKKKIPQGAVGSFHEPPPTTVEKALNHPTRSWDWLKSLLDEWLGLE